MGVIEELSEALRVVDTLRASGFEPELLRGERGLDPIETAGGSVDDVRVMRIVQNLFGYETTYAERHMAELTAGRY